MSPAGDLADLLGRLARQCAQADARERTLCASILDYTGDWPDAEARDRAIARLVSLCREGRRGGCRPIGGRRGAVS